MCEWRSHVIKSVRVCVCVCVLSADSKLILKNKWKMYI